MRRPHIANLTEMYYKEEKSPGHWLDTQPWTRLRMRGESLTQDNVVNSARVMDGTRSLSEVTIVPQEVAGTINCILSPRDIDVFLEATLRNKWTTLQLSQGDIDRTFAFLLVHTNGVDKNYTLFTGCAVTATTFNFQVNSYVGFELSVVGTGADYEYTPQPSEVFSPSSENAFFVGLDGRLNIDGDTQAFITAFSGSFGHAHSALRVIDHVQPYRLRPEGFEADAQLVLAFDGRGSYEEYLNRTSFNLNMQVQYNNERYTFIFPKCVVTNHESPSSGVGSIVGTADITPLYSVTHGSTVIVKRETI